MDDLNFCPTCGKSLPLGTSYCPACGARLNDPQADQMETAVATKESSDRILVATILILLNAAILIIGGVYLYFTATEISEYAFDITPSLIDSFTVESLAGFIKSLALIGIIGGAIGLVSALLVFMRRLWILAVIFCLVAAAIGITTLIGLVLGLIAIWMLFKSKPLFTD